MPQIAEWMKQAITQKSDKKAIARLRAEVTEFALQFPLPSDKEE